MEKFYFEGHVRLHLKHVRGSRTSTHEKCDIRLDVSNNLDHRKYLNKGIPTADGAKVLTVTFVQALVANVHASEQMYGKSSAEHLKEIIADLEKGIFDPGAIVREGMM